MTIEDSVPRQPWFRDVSVFVAAVSVVAIVLVIWIATLEPQLVDRSKVVYVTLFAVLLFIGEVRTRWFRFADGGEVTPGWAFAFGIVLFGAPLIAVAAMATCTLYVDIRDRKDSVKVLFNASQITASLAAGALVLQGMGLREAITDGGALTTKWALGIVLAGAVIFTVNGLLTCVVLALHYCTSLRSMIGRSFFLSVSADAALLALSPVFVVAIDFSLLMLPSMGVTALLIYQSTQQALRRAHEASHDNLTQLLNRRTFDTHLAGFLGSAVDDEVRGAVALLDLDGFKEVNDRLGHQTGDSLLQGVADRLAKSAPKNAVVARLGGDEFAVLIPDDGASEANVLERVHAIRNAICEPIEVDGFHLSVGVSIGMAMIPTHGRTAEDLLGAADVAMYRAKRFRTGVESYQIRAARTERGRLGLVGELANALEQEQLSIHYQPLVSLSDGTPRGAEALLRWHHPTFGDVPPDEFITLAEHTDIIGPLTQFVLDRSTRDWTTIADAGMRISINVSARNLQDRRFPTSVLRTLELQGLPTSCLEIEITESAIASEPERSMFAISELREAGVSVAIDDFGTGYSSFAMLRDFTVDRLKIDASFISGIAHSQRQQHLVRAIVGLAQRLQIETVAEGIESHESWVTLAELGCDIGQGFLVSKAMPASELVPWLASRMPIAMAVEPDVLQRTTT